MTSEQLKLRTRKFAIDVIKLVEYIPKSTSTNIIANQLLRSATSVGANYRAACRVRSTADFISKITIVEEEADESQYWIELLMEINFGIKSKAEPLLNEAAQLTAIFTSSGKTAKTNRR
ncbi:MAG: four helix bundle protein [Chitinophagales bacterium]